MLEPPWLDTQKKRLRHVSWTLQWNYGQGHKCSPCFVQSSCASGWSFHTSLRLFAISFVVAFNLPVVISWLFVVILHLSVVAVRSFLVFLYLGPFGLLPDWHTRICWISGHMNKANKDMHLWSYHWSILHLMSRSNISSLHLSHHPGSVIHQETLLSTAMCRQNMRWPTGWTPASSDEWLTFLSSTNATVIFFHFQRGAVFVVVIWPTLGSWRQETVVVLTTMQLMMIINHSYFFFFFFC